MKIGIGDTMFARVDMYKIVMSAIKDSKEKIDTERYTVPGVKDLPVACLKLFDDYQCDIVLALGMPGKEKIDKQCSHEASLAIQQVQLQTKKHILEVFVHLDEGNEKEVKEIAKKRVYNHTMNAIALLRGKETLSPKAGKGIRQGKNNEGSIE